MNIGEASQNMNELKKLKADLICHQMLHNDMIRANNRLARVVDLSTDARPYAWSKICISRNKKAIKELEKQIAELGGD